MPSRYLRATYIDSKKVNALSAEGERMFCRLLVHVDDFGRCESDPALLRGKLFARKENQVSTKDIARWLHELEATGLITTYESGGEGYLQMLKWEQGRAVKSRYPAPPHPEKAAHTPILGVLGGAESPVDPPRGAPERDMAGFDAFWSAYPKRVGKRACEAKWCKIKNMPEMGTLLVALEAQKASAQWQAEGGKFIPHPLTWLSQGRWEDDGQANAINVRSFEDA